MESAKCYRGPQQNPPGSSNYYIYAESSSASTTTGGSGTQGNLHSLGYDGSVCTGSDVVTTISFDYHMYGATIGYST